MSIPILILDDVFVFPKCEVSLSLNDEQRNIILKSFFDHRREFIAITNIKNYVKNKKANNVGTLCEVNLDIDPKDIPFDEIKKVISNKKQKIKITGLYRINLLNTRKENDYLMGQYEIISDKIRKDEEYQLLKEKWLDYISDFVEKSNFIISPELLSNDVISAIDYIVQNSEELDGVTKYRILSEEFPFERLEILFSLPNRKNIDKELDKLTKEKIREEQENYYLRKKKEAIESRLYKYDHDMGKYLNRLEKENFPPNIKELILQKADQYYKSVSTNSSEANMLRSYMEWIFKIPWSKQSEEINDINWAKDELDKKHYGLIQVKDRILEYLAARIKSGKSLGQIICLLGPPGVGKTSLGTAIAKATGREFVSISVGGVNDESEIRGSRYTYIGSFPGRIVKSLISAQTMNPLILIDEIDKMGSSHHGGNPANALLEVLDSHTNIKFVDTYLGEEAPCDLSKVFFICTANYEEDIPLPLFDRLEIIRISSYTTIDKINISKKYLIPEYIEMYNLSEKDIVFNDEGLTELIEYYTRESGVRELKNRIGTIFRKFIKDNLLKNEKNKKKLIFNKKTILEYLKKRIYEFSETMFSRPGLFNGLAAWSRMGGGDILPIEVAHFKKTEDFDVTGNLGDIIKESCRVALTFIKANATKFGIDPDFFSKNCIHVHFTEAATPKDGPSAGCAITTAIISSILNRSLPRYYAATGEITLHGQIQKIGGLKEKAIAAHRQKIKTIFIPKDNENDIEDIPEEVKKDLKIILVGNYDEVWNFLFTTKKNEKVCLEKKK